MKFKPVIKRSGSKRGQSEEIIKYFPKEIDTYYEPFIGGGSVLFQLLHSDIKVKDYICSDINNDLINLWNVIKKYPTYISKSYEGMWNELNKDEDIERRKFYYYHIRNRFNDQRDVADFFFLTRTCINGLIRYNSKGEFNASFHFSRKGINPKEAEKIINEWSNKISEANVKFICQDYKGIRPRENDFIYLDPPYINTKGMYFGQIDYNEFWDFLRNLKCDYAFSFDGISGDKDNTYNVPTDVYDKHIYTDVAISGFGKIHQKKNYVQESLYLAYNPHRDIKFEF